MKAKKLESLLRSILASAVISGMAFSAVASDGTINITGTILDSACTVDTTQATQTVNLGLIQRTAFGEAGSVAGATRFSISLKNCPSTVKSASVTFDGNANKGNADILALNSGQTAEGVGVAFYEADGVTAIPLATKSAIITLDTASTGEPATPANVNQLTYVAKYKSTQAAVKAGTANATSDFTITYQ